MTWHLMESKRFLMSYHYPKSYAMQPCLITGFLIIARKHQTTEISTRTLKQLCPNSLRNKASFDDAISHLMNLNRVKIVNQGKRN